MCVRAADRHRENHDMNDTSTTTPTTTPEEERYWTNLFDKHGIPPEQRAGWRKTLERRFPWKPRKPRSEPAVLDEATTKISDVINNTPPGQDIPSVAVLMKHAGLDPTNRSDAAWIRRFLRDNEQLTYIAPIKPQLVRRIGSS
jgi:hypothetical protein